MHVFSSCSQVAAAVGQDLGTSDWLRIDQQRIDAFADTTGDHQWIHVDPARARSGPFGSTIAHGYLTLSLVAGLGRQIFRLETPGAKINYGVDRVRFLQPVRNGDSIRTRVKFTGVRQIRAGQVLNVHHVIEIQRSGVPAAVVDALILIRDEERSMSCDPLYES